MKVALIFLLSLFSFTAFAQQDKTTLLRPVVIYGLPEEKFLTGSTVAALDSSLKANGQSQNLSEILSYQFPIYFRTYGNGMLSSISMRGTSPQHTSVLWNGININSFSLGQADFSTLPAAAFDEVKVNEGAGSARYGSGAFGGSVLLNSLSDTKNYFSLARSVGSFGRIFSSNTINHSFGRWHFKTNAYNLTSKNNFTILSTGERQQHASFSQAGILQDIDYQFSQAKILSVHYWYHNADRAIQPPIGTYNSKDTQQDINHRVIVEYKSNSHWGLFSARGGYINDAIIFNSNPSYVIRWITGVKHEFVYAKKIHVQTGAEWNHIIGNISEYQNGHAKEDRFDFTAAIQKNIGERLSLVLNLRQPIVSHFNAPFLPYFGVEYLLLKGDKNEFQLRGNISKNYRVPTLNDRYWQDAGNKDLLPEKSNSGELGWRWKNRKIEITNTWFTQKVDNWIQWIPDATGNFRPKNIEQVLARGMEIKINAKQHIGQTWIVPMLSYQFTQSTVTKTIDQQYVVNKQLIFTPRNTASAYVKALWLDYSVDVSAQYSGIRFTEASNTDAYALPAYVLFNFSAGRNWIVHQHRFDIRLSVKNILNTDYQLYSAHALPGRSYDLQFNYQFNPKIN